MPVYAHVVIVNGVLANGGKVHIGVPINLLLNEILDLATPVALYIRAKFDSHLSRQVSSGPRSINVRQCESYTDVFKKFGSNRLKSNADFQVIADLTAMGANSWTNSNRELQNRKEFIYSSLSCNFNRCRNWRAL